LGFPVSVWDSELLQAPNKKLTAARENVELFLNIFIKKFLLTKLPAKNNCHQQF
jgi:hypothetical protein